MDEQLKQRLVGAAVIISLGVIFFPIILDGGNAEFRKVHIKIPPAPEVDYASSIEPLAGETKPELPVVKKPSAESNISRLPEKATSGRYDDAEPTKPVKAFEEAGGGGENNPTGKPPATGAKLPISESAPAPQARLTQKPAPSNQEMASSAVTAWVIQVGSFSSRANAIELRDKLRENGFTSFVESFESTGKSSHRVRIGPEIDRSRAEESLGRLKSKLAMNGIIVSYP